MVGTVLAVLLSAGSAAHAQSVAEEEPRQRSERAFAPSTPNALESYGSAPQQVTLGAASFSPQADAEYAYSNGYIYRTGGTSSVFWAPVNLPNGAVVEDVCVSLYDTNAANVFVEWGVYELGDQVAAPTFTPISSGSDNWMAGYHFYCVPTPFHTVHSAFDEDGDGRTTPTAYRVAVYLSAADNTMRLGGVLIQYHLQVTPAPAVATFPNDVPTTHPFFRFVEALAAAGITAGTGPGTYGIDDPVTRGQMAVFLSIALGLHFPN
jgi:hypothetical protein